MNSFSLSKFLTGVLIVLSSQVTFAELDGRGYQAMIECAQEACKTDPKSEACVERKAYCTEIQEKINAGEKAREAKNDCKEAMKTWRDASSAGARACNAFDKSIGKNCSERIKACQSKIDGTFNSDSNESGDQNLAMIMQIAKQKIGTNSNAIASDAVMGGTACVKSYDAKTQKENEKDFTREKRELEARVKKETDEQAKQNEKLREKKDEISKKITELEAKLKKSEEARAKSSSEAATAYQKKVVESGKTVRSLTTAILQEQQKLTKARFASQTALLDLTDDKILNRCKQQLISVKNALVSNTPAAGTSATDAQIKGIKDSIGTGAKGTANLNAYLKQIKDACFQQENTKKQSAMLQATQDTESANSRIEELQKSIKDEENSLKIAKDANDAASKQAATEKTNEVTQKEKDAANLNTELQNFMDSVNEKMKISKAEAAKITEEIQQLTLKKQFNVEPAYDEAEDAITKAENARVSAVKSCDCGKTKNSECTMLNNAPTNPDPDKSEKSSGRSKTESAN